MIQLTKRKIERKFILVIDDQLFEQEFNIQNKYICI